MALPANDRLDSPTSGVLLFGKSLPAARSLAAQFRERRLQKGYLAVLLGSVQPSPFDVEAPIANHPTAKELSYVPPPAEEAAAPRKSGRGGGARSALTRFTPLRAGEGGALCAVRPVTGRMHQIRVHAEHAGHPLAGDTQYGSGMQPSEPCGRLLLHAHSLEVEHPATAERVRFVAPLPADFVREMARLGIEHDDGVEAASDGYDPYR